MDSTITANSALFIAHQKASKRMKLVRAFHSASRKRKPTAPRLIACEKRLFSGVHFPQLGPLEQF